MAAIERDNPALKDVLPKGSTRARNLDKTRLGTSSGHGQQHPGWAARRRAPRTFWAAFMSTSWSSSRLQRAGRVASSTPRAPSFASWLGCCSLTRGRVYDPCCGSSGMFVQSMAFIDAHIPAVYPHPALSRRVRDRQAGVAPGRKSRYTARNPTTRRGEWQG